LITDQQIISQSKLMAEFFKANAGDARDQFGNAGILLDDIIAQYIERGAYVVACWRELPLFMALTYPVSRKTYTDNIQVHNIDETSDVAYIKAIACLPKVRPNGFKILSALLLNRWPRLRYAYGYRGGRKTRLTRLVRR